MRTYESTYNSFCELVDMLLEDGQIEAVEDIIQRQTNRNGINNAQSQQIIDMCNQKLKEYATT